MMWTVKTIFTDRRNGVAAVAHGAAAHNLALMGLRSRPGWKGYLVDELVLATPGGWDAARLEDFILAAGGSSVRVTPLDEELNVAPGASELAARRAHPAGAGRTWLAHPQAS